MRGLSFSLLTTPPCSRQIVVNLTNYFTLVGELIWNFSIAAKEEIWSKRTSPLPKTQTREILPMDSTELCVPRTQLRTGTTWLFWFFHMTYPRLRSVSKAVEMRGGALWSLWLL